MKKYFFLVILLIFNTLTQIFCQTNNLEITGKIETLDGVAIPGATAEIFDGNSKINSVNSDMNGELSFTLEYGKSYKIYISKPGLIKKRLDFETNIPVAEQRKLFKEFSMTLVESCEGADLSVFEEPIDKIEYDFGIRNFASNKSTYNQMTSRVSAAYQELERCKQSKFQEKKNAADVASKQGNFEEAKKLYQEALQFYPNDAAVKRLIGQSQKNIEQQSKNQSTYQQIIQEADQFLAQNQLSAAKQRYAEAAKLNPTESYPQEKMKEIDANQSKQLEQQKQQQATNNQYNDILAQANTAMASKNYPMAKQLYEQAAQLRPSEAFPSQKAAEAQKTMEKLEQDKKTLEENEKAFREAIAQGQLAMDKGDFKTAQDLFLSAIPYKPNESLPRQKIAEAQKLETQKKGEELQAQRAEVMKHFNETVQKADGLLALKDYDNAIKSYKEALEIVPSDGYTQSQIINAQNQKVEELKKQSTEIEKAYTDALTLGDAKKLTTEFDAAMEAYQQALKAKPEDPVALARVKETQKLIADQQIRIKNEQETKALYNKLIQEGDAYFQAQNYEDAKLKYNEALTIYSTQSYPANQIATINNILTRSQKEAEYNKIITEADRLFDQQDYTNAKTQYNAASLLIPEKTYPQQKLNEISSKLSDLSRKEIQDKYDKLAAQAEETIVSQNFDEAKKLYTQAMQVMPENPYPKTRINEINSMISDRARKEIEEKYNSLVKLADTEIEKQNYVEAKVLYSQALIEMPDNPYPQKRINEINALISDKAKKDIQEKYDALAIQAEEQVTQQNYDQAKSLYNQASQIMPENPKPVKRINEINALISEKARKEIEEKYNTLVQQADAEINQQNYLQAKLLYSQALVIMPDNPYPQKRINEINVLISENSKKDIQGKYDALTAQAEQQVSEKNYNQAKALYLQAMQVMPENPYPQKRINEINVLMDELLKSDKEQKYNELITEADAYFNQQQYDQAKSVYGKAQVENPDKTYPAQKINEINQIIYDRAKKEIDTRYNNAVSEGDRLFAEQKYSDARTSYLSALQIIPEQVYPQQKINEISSILANTAKTENDKAEKKTRYDQTIVLADKYFNEKNYPLARVEYTNALAIFPDESHPSSQLTKIEQLVAEQKQKEVERLELEKKFNSLITSADELFKTKKYDESRQIYLQSLELKPSHPHAASQIKRIDEIIATQTANQQKLAETNTRYDALIAEADAKFNGNNLADARKLYYASLEIKPNEEYPKTQIKKIEEKVKLLATNQPDNNSTVTEGSTQLDELKFKTESEKARYLAELKKTYQSGVTLETYKEKNRTINRYIVIRGTEVHELREILYSYGVTECLIDGKPTNAMYLQSFIKPKAGENFNKIEK